MATVQAPLDWSPVYEILDRWRGKPGAEVSILEEIQHHYGYVPEEACRTVAAERRVSVNRLYGIVTFYHGFFIRPKGKLIRACAGSACWARGQMEVNAEIKRLLEIGDKETTRDGAFALEEMACLDACQLAPIIRIDEKPYAHVRPEQIKEILEQERASGPAAGAHERMRERRLP